MMMFLTTEKEQQQQKNTQLNYCLSYNLNPKHQKLQYIALDVFSRGLMFTIKLFICLHPSYLFKGTCIQDKKGLLLIITISYFYMI